MHKPDRKSGGAARGFALAGAAAMLALSVPALADVKAGVDAWSAGDFDRAVAEWEGPARAGDADALFNLAQAYRLGRGVAVDSGRALQLYAQAMQKGHVKAADNYGLMLFHEGNREAAMPLIRAAAERGDPRAQYVLGLAHFNADHAAKDWVRAYALVTLSHAQGLPQAGEALAQMDLYVPENQRQMAQSLARDMEAEATRRRAAELAAIDLAPGPVPQPVAPPRLTSADTAVQIVPQPRQVAPAAPRPARAKGEWKVQLGAFGVAGNADRLWAKLSGNPALAGTEKLVVSSGKFTRLLASGFASKTEASSACSRLKAQGQGCLVTKS